MLPPTESPAMASREASRFFADLAVAFRDPDTQRGCLIVNSITELAQRNAEFTPLATRLATRYHTAFSNALRGAVAQGAMDRRLLDRRVKLLASSAHGVWVHVRANPRAAAAACRAIAREIDSWNTNGTALARTPAGRTRKTGSQVPRSATVSKP